MKIRGDRQTVGVLGYDSIKERLKGLHHFGITQTAEEILSLPPDQRPPALSSPFARDDFLIVDPFYTQEELAQNALLGNVSLDVELGDIIKVTRFPSNVEGIEEIPEDLAIDFDDPKSLEEAEKYDVTYRLEPGKSYKLWPGSFVRAYTMRRYFMPNNLMAFIEGKSKFGRAGVTTHVTAPKIDPGFAGRVVLEIAHLGRIPIILRVGMRIGQLMFFTVEGEIGVSYDALHEESYGRQEGVHYLAPPMEIERRYVNRYGILPLITQVEEAL